MPPFVHQPIIFFRYVERTLGLMAIAWGIWIDFLGAGDAVTAYFQVGRYAPVWILGTIVLVCGLAIFIFRLVPVRVVIHAALFVCWLVVSITFLLHDFHNTGAAIYAGLAFLHAGLYWWLTYTLRITM